VLLILKVAKARVLKNVDPEKMDNQAEKLSDYIYRG
jgi:hypothetical protein